MKKNREITRYVLINFKICIVLLVLMQTNLKAQTPAVLQSISYKQQGDLTRFYGISLRREGLTTVDNQNKHAWEIDTVQSLRISDIRYPAGSQSYLMTETEHTALLTDCQTALGCGNSRTHAPQFTNAHLNHLNTTRFSLGNEPPIHTSDFLPYGGYKNWVIDMLTMADTSKTYFQSAQAVTIFNWDSLTPSQQAQQGPVWDTAVAAWADGSFACRGIATTEKNRNVNAKTLTTLRNHLNLYAIDFPGAKTWFTEWNTTPDPLAQAENDYLQLGVAEMLLACARLYYETNGQIEALHYHQGWNAQSGGNLINMVAGEWVLGKAGEVYRDFAPLFYGKWGDYVSINQDTLLTIEAFISEDNRYAVAYINKNSFDVTTTLGFVAHQRSYGVIYYDLTTSANSDIDNVQARLIVYTNPFSNELMIMIEGNNENIKFEIINMSGQIVFKGNVVEKTVVETNNFTSGVYLVKFENGGSYEFKKLIKN
jgi:hypothetical protein